MSGAQRTYLPHANRTPFMTGKRLSAGKVLQEGWIGDFLIVEVLVVAVPLTADFFDTTSNGTDGGDDGGDSVQETRRSLLTSFCYHDKCCPNLRNNKPSKCAHLWNELAERFVVEPSYPKTFGFGEGG
eukprot:4552043-Amphidinium_carterae.1